VAERICVAQIGAAHGIRGEVKLKSFTADPMAVKDYGPFESEDGSARFTIETERPAKGHLVARFRGVDDRNAAERLTHIKLFVPRERLPPADDGEFYHADLIGLSAVTADGTAVGTVVAIHDFGAGNILELRPPAVPRSCSRSPRHSCLLSISQAGASSLRLPRTSREDDQVDPLFFLPMRKNSRSRERRVCALRVSRTSPSSASIMSRTGGRTATSMRSVKRNRS
jgi:16S rRNA processing protein RimM